MDKETAFEILKKSIYLQEILIDDIFRNDILNKKFDYKKKGTIEFQIYQGIFDVYHTISNTIQNKLFQEFPELKKEYEKYKDKNAT